MSEGPYREELGARSLLSRRSFSAGSAAALAASALSSVGVRASHAQVASERPNFVVLMTDDLDERAMQDLDGIRSLMGSNGTTFTLFEVNADGSTTRITDAPVTLSSDGLSATLDPFGTSSILLEQNTRYKAVVTAGAKDLASNALDQNSVTTDLQQKA